MGGLLADRAGATRPADPLVALEAFTRFHIRFHHARGDAVCISYMELRNLTAENVDAIEVMRKTYEADLQTILEQGVRSGAFELPDAKVASMAVIAMLTGVNTWYRDDGRLSLSEVEEIYWSMVRKSVARG